MKSTAMVALSLFVVLIGSGGAHAHEIQVSDFYNHTIGWVERFTDCGADIFNSTAKKFFGIDINSDIAVYPKTVYYTSTNCTSGSFVPTLANSLKDQNSYFRFFSDAIVSLEPTGSPSTSAPTVGSWSMPTYTSSGTWVLSCMTGTPPAYPANTLFIDVTADTVPSKDLKTIHYDPISKFSFPLKFY